MSEAALLEVLDGVARLTLNRPEAGNAIDPSLVAALRDHTVALRARDDVRVVLLGAAGGAFCVGGDLRFMQDAGDGVRESVQELADAFHEAIAALAEIDAPVVSVVQGVAAGGGMSLALAADLVLAASTARFTMAYTKAGLSPDGGSTWVLPRLVGHRRATELMLVNEVLDARAAAQLGLVTRVVDDGALAAEAEALAAQLLAGSRSAQAAVKRLLARSPTSALADQLAEESRSIAALAESPDGREGIAAFLEKRAPRFS